MRPICVICTDIFVINSQISACNCGHIFHEECLFRWIKSSSSGANSNQTCPQCRAKISQSTIIKRLYLTEADLSSSQLSTTNITDILNDPSNEVISKKYEELLNLCEDLKHSLKDKSEQLNAKVKLVEQKDKKIKELEDTTNANKKRLNESQVLVDYLKKEMENYNKIKDQYESREKQITNLELKLREYKSIDLIYKEHTSEFENEMKKYLTIPSSVNPKSVINQLVSTNVLLKEQLDKQTEDKKVLRKKLLHIEKTQTDKDKFLAKKQQDILDLQTKVTELEGELSRLKTSNQSPALIINSTIGDEEKLTSANRDTPNNSKNDSDLQYLTQVNKLENSYIRKREIEEIVLSDNDPEIINDSITSGQLPSSFTPGLNSININNNKRKNPFKKSDSFPRNIIAVNNSEEDDDDEKIVSPPSKMNNNFNFSRLIGKDSPDIKMAKPIKPVINKMKSSTSILSNKDNKLNETSMLIKPLPVSSNYQFDGLGGRKKIFKSSSSLTSSKTTSSSSMTKLTRSKVT